MKTLSNYEKFEDPIILRADLVRDSHGGVGYHGSRLKCHEDIVKSAGMITPQGGEIA